MREGVRGFDRWCEKKLTEDAIGGPRIYTLYAPSSLLFFDVTEGRRVKRTRREGERERERKREKERTEVKEAKEKWKKKSPN